ncbi:hypothetical protein OPV22_025848 [Ensete ventricosum]|uniref:Uncharacterized protein n=1 Tax=Ensete ventricosum TaxID=4639 RepID=A0AAV8QAZ3_ENSVE|nr:hypothetical protein OPV22_025848 [Ensete ventricosum]
MYSMQKVCHFNSLFPHVESEASEVARSLADGFTDLGRERERDKYYFSCRMRRRVALELRAGGNHMHAALQKESGA